MALRDGNAEAAKILASKGAVCTEEEKQRLGEKYTNFKLQNAEMEELKNKRPRRAIRHWMVDSQLDKLQQWLRESRNQLESLFETGDVPVVGWSQLSVEIKSLDERKKNLLGEREKNARENQLIQQQIDNLKEKQEGLEKRNKEIQLELKWIGELAILEPESDSISMLAKKEGAARAKVEEKMQNPYFMGDLDFCDVSTLFSLFEMDGIFTRLRDSTAIICLDAVLRTSVAELEKNLKSEFSEVVELLFKLKLLENREKSVAHHLAKCPICNSHNPAALLEEHGLAKEEWKEMGISEKMREWKGFFLVTISAGATAAALRLTPPLSSKFIICLDNLQKAHNWNTED